MPLKINRTKRSSNGLSEAAFMFFGYGPFFEAEDFEERTTPAERAEIWETHKEAIIARFHKECPHQPPDFKTHGETLEEVR
jgi:hypothetical protein